MTTFSISGVIRDHARNRADMTAITEAGTGRSVSWSQLDANVDKVAGSLIADGVQRGDRVVFLGHNCIELFELYFATVRIGATFAPLNWNLNRDEIATLLQDMGAAKAVVDPKFAPRLDGALETGPAYIAWREAGGAWSGLDEGQGMDVVVQPYTSGTTGMPKGVMLTNDNVSAFVHASAELHYEASSTHLLSLPNYHIGGCVFPLLAVVAGGHVVIVDRFTPASVLDTIEKFRITHINLVPTMINMVIEEQEKCARDVSSMQLVVYGAAPVTASTVERAQRVLGVSLLQEYASTECITITALGPDEHTKDRLKSVGRPFPGVEIQIREVGTGELLPTGRAGEICVRSEQCTQGYWRRPEETLGLNASDGYIRTGDLGFLDADDYLYLTGRVKDMIVTGGENIYPAEVEAVLAQHDQVSDVAVVGVPDERWGELVVAFVVAADGSQLVADELLAWSHSKLTGYRRPRQVVFVDALPRNLTGKIERRVLRESSRPDGVTV